MGAGAAILVVLAFLALLFGLAELTQATTGVGVIAAGCLLAILGRMSQADHHHKKLLEALAKVDAPTK